VREKGDPQRKRRFSLARDAGRGRGGRKKGPSSPSLLHFSPSKVGDREKKGENGNRSSQCRKKIGKEKKKSSSTIPFK